jgi:ketosteroid isomerase-like protein
MQPIHTILVAASVGAGALALAACHPAAQASAPADLAKIAADLKAGEAQWNLDLAAKDAARDAAHYADDATVMAPGFAPMRGKATIEATMGQVMKDPNFSLAFAPDIVAVSPSGEMAYSQGHFTESESDAKTHAKLTSTGSYVTVYRKEPDGSWKAVEDIATPGAPAKG